MGIAPILAVNTAMTVMRNSRATWGESVTNETIKEIQDVEDKHFLEIVDKEIKKGKMRINVNMTITIIWIILIGILLYLPNSVVFTLTGLIFIVVAALLSGIVWFINFIYTVSIKA